MAEELKKEKATNCPSTSKPKSPAALSTTSSDVCGRPLDKEPDMQDTQKPFGKADPHIHKDLKVRQASQRNENKYNTKPATAAKQLSPERIPTGIPGLDQLIEGGLKKDSITLVGGSAGAGKTIFSIHYLIEGIRQYGEPGVYVSFEEDKEEMYEDMLRFGWDLQKLEDEGKFAFIQYTPEQVNKLLKTGGGVIRDIIDKLGAKRLVIDSISTFTLLHKGALQTREAVLELFSIIKSWGCTALVLGQYSDLEKPHESKPIEFEVDNIIWLYNIKREDVRVRAIEVFKMRGTKHSSKTYPFEIKEKGIIIYPEESVF